jgi:aldose sugar dehydrogenase
MSQINIVAEIILFVIIVCNIILSISAFHQEDKKVANASMDGKYPESKSPSPSGPTLTDPNLKAEVVFSGLTYSTDLAFLEKNDLLVIEKDTGIVRRIINSTMLPEPLLDVSVATFGHRGLLGIAVSNITSAPFPSTSGQFLNNQTKNDNNKTPVTVSSPTRYVFLYYTAIEGKDGDDITQGKQPLGNVVYRYELADNRLIKPKLLLTLPATPGAIGNGGKILVNPYDNNLYITIGGVGIDGHKTEAQNVRKGLEPDGTSGILVITQDGQQVTLSGILGNKDPLSKYYAYGIWNSFGIDFDPLTGRLWDTENGVIFGDEINLVEPGFNSGWNKIDGIWLRGYPVESTEANEAPNQTDDLLVDFNGKGKYSPPEFTWFDDVGPTAIRFFDSDRMGKLYEDDLFVGDIMNGNIYHFELNKQRTELLPEEVNGPLSDKVVNSNEDTGKIIFGRGFGGITDIEVGPQNGYLYVLTFNDTQGTIFRISANNSATA